MKKEIALSITTVLLVATPVFAAPGNSTSEQAKTSHGSSAATDKKSEKAVLPAQTAALEVTVTEVPTVTVTPTVSLTTTPTPSVEVKGKGSLKKVQGAAVEGCDPNAQWKNHGEYVSCVAKTHLGGEAVSAAARSDVGKKHPSLTPTATPSASPTETPTLTPTPPISAPELVLGISSNPLETFIKAVGRFFEGLPFIHGHKKA